MRRSFVLLSVIVVLAAGSMACMTTNGPEPAPDDYGLVCWELSGVKGQTHGVLLRCQDREDPPPPQPQKGPCTGIVAALGGPFPSGACVANCQACALTAQQRQQLEGRLDAACNDLCKAQGACPQGQECVRDQVLNITETPNCIPRSEFCRRAGNPAAPALCIEISLVGECTCKCQ